MAPVSQLPATKAKLVNRRDFDSHSLERAEAALSFWHVFSLRARHDFILCHPITAYTIEPVATRAGGVMATASGLTVGGQKVKNACRCLNLTRWLTPWVLFSLFVACSSGRNDDVVLEFKPGGNLVEKKPSGANTAARPRISRFGQLMNRYVHSMYELIILPTLHYRDCSRRKNKCL